jgi:hypothetical protein
MRIGMMKPLPRRAGLIALAATALALSTPASSGAQQQVLGPRWQGWVGCWSAAPTERLRDTGPDSPRIVCVTPTADGNVVDISAIAEGAVMSRDRIDASGASHAVEAPGCQGTESARWSADGRRVFLKSIVTCDGTPTEMSAILAITSTGEWLDVRRVAAGSGADVRVARYHDVGVPTLVPADIASSLDRRSAILFHDARLAAGAPVGTNAIIEASHATDPSVVEAWVMVSGQHFAVDARTLTELADAGVPATVTDAMISVSRPTEVAKSHTVFYSPYGWNGGNPYYGGRSADAWDQGAGRTGYVDIYEYDPWGWGYAPLGYGFGYVPFGYGMRYGIGNRFGDGIGIGYGFGYEHHSRNRTTPGSRVGYYYPPVIVLHNDPTGTEPRGRSVKGEGYTPDIRHTSPPAGEPRRAAPRTAPPRAEAAPAPREAPAPKAQPAPATAPASAPSKESQPRTARPRP